MRVAGADGLIFAALVRARVTAERAELWLARRNAAALLAKIAASHDRQIVLLHAARLASLWTLGADAEVHPGWLALFLLFQAARIITLPGVPLIWSGPYRWPSHPDDTVVVAEIAVLPPCLGLPEVTTLFSLANAAVLTRRISAENAALRAGPLPQQGEGSLAAI